MVFWSTSKGYGRALHSSLHSCGEIGVSQQQTLAALKALAEARIICQLSEGTYDRQYAATELFDLLGHTRIVSSARHGVRGQPDKPAKGPFSVRSRRGQRGGVYSPTVRGLQGNPDVG